MKQEVIRQDNATRRALELLSKKWVALTLYALSRGPMRLSEMQRTIEGVSQKMLIQTLRELELDGLVERTVHPVVPPHVDYRLTKLGESLHEPLTTLCCWGKNHMPAVERARQANRRNRPSAR